MLVGEQPGDAEDLAGHPFVGPAGKLLDRCLVEAGIDRTQTYVTNVVKHFKWVPRGPRRIHSKPGAVEIEACFPWLEAEISVVKPQIVVALGATAAQALFGKSFSRDPRPRPARALCAGALCARDSASLGIAARPGRGDPPPRDRAFHRGSAPGRGDPGMTGETVGDGEIDAQLGRGGGRRRCRSRDRLCDRCRCGPASAIRRSAAPVGSRWDWG